MSLLGSFSTLLRSGRVRACGVGVFALVGLAAAGSAQDAPELFEAVAGSMSPPRVAASFERTIVARQRLVRLREEAFEGDPRKVILNLFPDARYEFLSSGPMTKLKSGNRVWSARREGVEEGYAVFVLGPHGVRGNVSDGTGRHYKILPAGPDTQELRQIVPPLVDLSNDAESPPTPRGNSASLRAAAPPRASASGTPVWDMLIVYSAAARQWAGGAAGMQAQVDLVFAEMNQAFGDSQVDAEMRLVGLAEMPVPSPEDTGNAFLNGITNDPALAALRDQYGADFVSVWITPNAPGGGRAWIMQNVGPGFASNAFGVVRVDLTDGPAWSFAHEIGHNAGLAHDRDNASVNGAYAYSYGYQQKAQSPRFHTIMAYSSGCSYPCPTVNQFSNPNVSHLGRPTGIASGANSADAARTLNQTAAVAAAWRETVVANVTPSKAGIFSGGRWVLDSNGNNSLDGQDRNWILGDFAGSQPVTGDWNGDGQDDVGVFNGGFWFLDANGNGAWEGNPNDRLFAFGWPGVTPVVGDWNGDGSASVGVYSNGFWFLDYDGNGLWDGGVNDKIFGLGWAGVELVIGDWNGDGRDKIGVFSNGFWFLDYDGSYSWDGGVQDQSFGFGWTGVTPLVGDWNGDGKDSVAVYNNGSWFFDYDGNAIWNPGIGGDRSLALGWTGALPVIGDWNGDGRDKAGLYSAGNWFLDSDGDAIWSSGAGDRSFPWGGASDTPLPGRW